jgi:hypothetical protein
MLGWSGERERSGLQFRDTLCHKELHAVKRASGIPNISFLFNGVRHNIGHGSALKPPCNFPDIVARRRFRLCRFLARCTLV